MKKDHFYQLDSLYFQPDFISPVDDSPGSIIVRGPERDVLNRQTRSLGQEVKLGTPLSKLLVIGISPKWLESSNLKPGPLLDVDQRICGFRSVFLKARRDVE